MNNRLMKFTCEGARIHFVTLGDVVEQIRKAHSLSDYDTEKSGYAAALSQCLVSDRKEDNASTAVTLKFPDSKRSYTAIAESDGRVRGFCDDIEKSPEKVILEVTQKLTVRGDYSSIVEGDNVEDAIAQYYRTSQQVEAQCAVFRANGIYCCLLVEQFPITCEAEEYYRVSAENEWEYLKPLLRVTDITEDTLKIFDKYRKIADMPLRFGCTCTRNAVKKAISAVDKEELKNLADEDGFVSINCKYCGKHYRINICED